MKAASNKVINRVTKEILKPLGFVRISDRDWAYDGGWWLARMIFNPSSYAQGAYGEVGITCLLDWHAGGWIWNGVDGRRLWANYLEGEQFESEFRKMLDDLLPTALALINKIQSPSDFVDHMLSRRREVPSDFYIGMLLGVSGQTDAARDLFARNVAATDSPE